METKQSSALRKTAELTRERLAYFNKVMGYSTPKAPQPTTTQSKPAKKTPKKR